MLRMAAPFGGEGSRDFAADLIVRLLCVIICKCFFGGCGRVRAGREGSSLRAEVAVLPAFRVALGQGRGQIRRRGHRPGPAEFAQAPVETDEQWLSLVEPRGPRARRGMLGNPLISRIAPSTSPRYDRSMREETILVGRHA